MIKPEKMLDTQAFLKEVDFHMCKWKCTYLEALTHIAELKGLELESLASIVKSSVKAKALLQEDAEKLNFLPKTSRLPI